MARKQFTHLSSVVAEDTQAKVRDIREAIDAKALLDAKAWCAAHGLDTTEKQRAFIRKTLRSPTFMRPALQRQREPGDDDEDVAA